MRGFKVFYNILRIVESQCCVIKQPFRKHNLGKFDFNKVFEILCKCETK